MSDGAPLACSLAWRRGPFRLQCEVAFRAPWTVLFGPSGAGKSTLLRLLAGLERPQQGFVLAGPRLLTSTGENIFVPPRRRGIGYVAQRSALFPHLTVAANLEFAARRMPAAERGAAVEEAVGLTALSGLLGRRAAELSGGEAQRAALARMLASRPQILLLDEPLNALDRLAREDLLHRLREWLAARGVAAILVTHDPVDALAGHAEVVRLEAGRTTAQGPAAVVLAAERELLLRALAGPGTGTGQPPGAPPAAGKRFPEDAI